MQVIFPVVSSMGTTIGYLDGIYHAPGEIVAEIRHQSFWSISIVVLTIFTTSLVLYPIIIRLNRTLLAYSNTLALTNVGMLKVLVSCHVSDVAKSRRNFGFLRGTTEGA